MSLGLGIDSVTLPFFSMASATRRRNRVGRADGYLPDPRVAVEPHNFAGAGVRRVQSIHAPPAGHPIELFSNKRRRHAPGS